MTHGQKKTYIYKTKSRLYNACRTTVFLSTLTIFIGVGFIAAGVEKITEKIKNRIDWNY